MPTVVRKDANYSVHSTLAPDLVHHVVLSIPDRPTDKSVFVTIVLSHRGGSGDPIWFDFTSGGGLPPMTTTLTPGVTNSAVLLPFQMLRIDPRHWVDQVSLTSGGICQYSVWAMW